MFVKPKYISLKDEIEQKLSIIDLYQYYLNINIKSLPCKILSPIRKENNKSFNIYVYNNNIIWKDFALNESGDIYKLLSIMYELSFNEVLIKIKNDMIDKQYMVDKHRIYNIKSNKEIVSTNSSIEIIPYYFNDNSIPKSYWDYWAKYKVITKNILKKNNVFCAKYVYINNKLFATYSDEDILIIYKEKRKNIQKIYKKLYRPYNSENKWISNYRGASKWLVHGLQNIDKNANYIIITKSVKDKMVIESLNYNVINIQNEGISIPNKIMDYLHKIYTNIYILYDTDYNKSKDWGYIAAKKVKKEYNFVEIIHINSRLKCTDISETIEKYDSNMIKKILPKIIKK